MKWDLFVSCKLVLSRNIACTAAAITMFVLDVCKLLFLNVCHPTELLRVKTAQQKCHKYENCTGFNPFKTFLPANLTDCVEILFRSFSFVVNCWGEQSWSFLTRLCARRCLDSWKIIILGLHLTIRKKILYRVASLHCFSYN